MNCDQHLQGDMGQGGQGGSARGQSHLRSGNAVRVWSRRDAGSHYFEYDTMMDAPCMDVIVTTSEGLKSDTHLT